MIGPGTAQPRVLVYVGLDLVGDGLMKLPFLRALRHAFPGGELIWLAGKGQSAYRGTLAPLVKGLLDAVVDDADIGNHWSELVTRAPLAGQRFDLVIDTQRRLLTTLVLRRLKTQRFVSGTADYLFSDVKPQRRLPKPPAMVTQLLNLLQLATGQPPNPMAPLPLDAETLARAKALLPDGNRYVGLVPGAGGKHKCWPINEFVGVARVLRQEGRVPVFILGPDEQGMHQAIAAAVPSAFFPLQHVYATEVGAPPHLTIALGQRLQAAVANDSGGGHMMAASGCPLVSLFGPTDPQKFAPLTPRLVLLRAQTFGGSEMQAIPKTAVLAALEALLRGR